MNYIQLCQKLASESGVVPNAGPPGSASAKPSSIAGATGLMLRMTSWVQDAWLDIQNERADWQWMLREFTGTISAGQSRFSAEDMGVTRVRRWVPFANDGRTRTFSIYGVDEGVEHESVLSYVPWDRFYMRLRGSQPDPGKPGQYAIDPDDKLVFSPAPDGDYIVRGLIYRSPQTLVDGTDTPEMPEPHHGLIWVRGLIKADTFDESDARMLALLNDSEKRFAELALDQTDPFHF